MGFLNSLFNSAVRRAINDVVDKAVDNAFNSAENYNSTTANQQSWHQQSIQIIKPDISGTETIQPCFYTDDSDASSEGNAQRVYIFEKADCLYIGDIGAAEVDFAYYCANSEDEAYAYDGCGLPCIYVGLDETLREDCHFIKFNKINAMRTPVINHPRIIEKVEFEYTSTIDGSGDTSHYVGYRFYPVPNDRREQSCRELVLNFPINCDIELRNNAIKAFELMAATLNVDVRN